MIYSYKHEGTHYELVGSNQLQFPRRNLFAADSFTLVVGRNGDGKSHFLSGLANEVVKKQSGDLVRSAGSTGEEVVIFYTSSPFPGVSPRSSSRIRRLGPTSKKAVPSADLLASISAAFSSSGKAEVRLRSDVQSALKALAAGIFEMPMRLRGSLIEGLNAQLRIYESSSHNWARYTSNGEVEPADNAKVNMLAAQREIRTRIEHHLKSKMKIEDYRLRLHSLDLAMKRGRKKRNVLLQEFLDGVDGRSTDSRELEVAKGDIQRAVDDYGKKLLNGGTIRAKGNAAVAQNNCADDVLVYAVAGGSSGESALFDQFAKIDREVQKVSGEVGDLIIMIDEGDAFLHLKWQQKYIKFLDAFVMRVRAGFSSVQVILTTHSPVLMSDVPSDSVIRLGEFSRGVVTFAAPLHKILSSTVGAGSIGDFSADRIGEMLKGSRYVDEYMVDQVDDGFIRAELKRVLQG